MARWFASTGKKRGEEKKKKSSAFGGEGRKKTLTSVGKRSVQPARPVVSITTGRKKKRKKKGGDPRYAYGSKERGIRRPHATAPKEKRERRKKPARSETWRKGKEGNQPTEQLKLPHMPGEKGKSLWSWGVFFPSQGGKSNQPLPGKEKRGGKGEKKR